MTRTADIQRNTNETQIRVSINLDGTGRQKLNTGVPFLDHMLDQIARHGMFDLEVEAVGDLHIDNHHTVEDTGITLGMAVAKAIGDKKGIRRYGHAYVPLDEALSRVVIDFSGRPGLELHVPFTRAMIGTFDVDLTGELTAPGRTRSASRSRLIWLRLRATPRFWLGAVVVGAMILWAIVGLWVSQWSPADQDLINSSTGPSGTHWFGTDDIGQDIYAQTVSGLRKSLVIGLIAGPAGTLIAGMAVPGALIAFGISLRGAPLPGRGGRAVDLLVATALKIVVMPLVAFAMSRWVFGLDGVPLLAATMCAALPTAQNVFVYAVRYRASVPFARDVVSTTTHKSLRGPRAGMIFFRRVCFLLWHLSSPCIGLGPSWGRV